MSYSKKLALSLSDKHHPIVIYCNTGGSSIIGFLAILGITLGKNSLITRILDEKNQLLGFCQKNHHGNMRKIDIFGSWQLRTFYNCNNTSTFRGSHSRQETTQKKSCKIRFRMILRVHFFHAGHLVCRSIISKGGGNTGIYANEDFWVVSLLHLTFEFGQGIAS